MSFGYAVGDFLAVIKAVKFISDKIKKSPSQVKDARDDLANISGFIQEEEANRTNHISDPVEKARIQGLFQTCRDLVKKTNDALDRFEDLVSVNKKSKGAWAKLVRFTKRFEYDEKEIIRARERIHQALIRLAATFQTLDSKLLQHVSSVVERTVVDVGDTKAGVERTETVVKDTRAGVERAERGIERTEIVVGDTKAGVERTEKGVERTERGVERTERGIERTEVIVKDTKAGVERTEIAVGDTKAGVERTERGVERAGKSVERVETAVERTNNGIELTKAGIDQIHNHQNNKKQSIERRKIMDWICPSRIDYIDQQNALTNERERGVGEWFVDTQEFKSWLHGDRTTLLCSGMPGAGKTMTSSLIVSNILENFDNDDQTGVAYIYCQYLRHKEQTPEYLMSSILRQLLEQHNAISDEVKAAYNAKKEGKYTLDPSEISNLLNVVLGTFKKTFVIIDALDELSDTDRNGFVPKVLAIQQKFNVNVYATSRTTEFIAQKASNATQINFCAREEDLRYCIGIKLRRGSLLSENPDLVELATTKILQVAKGIFLLAVRYAEYLADLDLIGDIEEALDSLKPVSDPYDAFYTGAMRRIQARRAGNSNLALIAICWLFFAKRPLRQRELLHALAFSGRNPQIGKNIPAASHVLDMCAGLVVIDETHYTVSLFHKSFDDFLEKSHLDFFPLRDQIIGTTCVKYLSLSAFASGPCSEPDPAGPGYDAIKVFNSKDSRTRFAYGQRVTQYPFYGYAQQYWHDHIRGSELETASIVTDFLADSNKLSASRQGLEPTDPQTTGAHVAARFLLQKSLERHLELCQSELNVKDNFGRSPLSYAAEVGSVAAINHLVNAGANLDFEDDDFRWRKSIAYTPLSYAAYKGHVLDCRVLLQRGADVEYRDSQGRSALSYAAEGGSEAVVKLLLEHGSTIDSRDSSNRTALCYATEAGSAEVTSALLNHGANVNQVDNRKATPLLLAARAKSPQIISHLVARGAKVNMESLHNDTPLSRAVEAGLIDSVRLLLQKGAEVDVYTSPEDPLSQACKTGPREMIPLLLSAGGNVKHLNNRRAPPLAYAARNGWTDMVQLCLDKGAVADHVDRQSRSVLSYAVEGGSTECVELLLEKGADIHRVNRYLSFCEQIYYALGMKYYNDGECSVLSANERMLRLLLSRGANPNRLVDAKRTVINMSSPLFYAMRRLPVGDPSTKRVLELLLQHGAKVDEGDGKEPVLSCAQRHPADVQNLLHQYSAI